MKTSFFIPLFLVLTALGLSYQADCQDVPSLLSEAQQLQDSRKENDALRKYLEVLKVQPTNLVALCKASELHSLIGNQQSSTEEKINLFRTARRYAEIALRVNPNYSDANFVMSMAMGRLALVLDGKEKIAAVNDIKKYAEIAVRNDPANFKAYHVLGKWHYEVSSLSSFERFGARLLFGGLPASSFAESIKNYEKSRSLDPDFTLNYLEVAKVYHKNQQDKKAVEVLRKLESMPTKQPDDSRIKKEGRELLDQLLD